MWLPFSKSIDTFSPALLNNSPGLIRYLKGEAELNAIELLAKNSSRFRIPTQINPYFNRWHVIWVSITYPVTGILSATFYTVATVLNSIWLREYAAFFEVASRQLSRQWEQVTDQWDTNPSIMLMPSFNVPKMSAWDVYMCHDISNTSIDDSKVKPFSPKQAAQNEGMELALDQFYRDLDTSRLNQSYFRWAIRSIASLFFTRNAERSTFKKTFETNPHRSVENLKEVYKFDQIETSVAKLYQTLLQNREASQSLNQIKLYDSRGLCRGGTEWFIRLLLKSEHFFADPAQHIMAVAKQFEKGISGQGLVLQALVNCSKLLDQKVKMMNNNFISTFELDDGAAESALKKIESLPTGVYRVGVYQHSLVHIKLVNGDSYTWDPEYGLFEHNAKTFLEFIMKHHYVKESPSSVIYFEKHEAASNSLTLSA